MTIQLYGLYRSAKFRTMAKGMALLTASESSRLMLAPIKTPLDATLCMHIGNMRMEERVTIMPIGSQLCVTGSHSLCAIIDSYPRKGVHVGLDNKIVVDVEMPAGAAPASEEGRPGRAVVVTAQAAAEAVAQAYGGARKASSPAPAGRVEWAYSLPAAGVYAAALALDTAGRCGATDEDMTALRAVLRAESDLNMLRCNLQMKQLLQMQRLLDQHMQQLMRLQGIP